MLPISLHFDVRVSTCVAILLVLQCSMFVLFEQSCCRLQACWLSEVRVQIASYSMCCAGAARAPDHHSAHATWFRVSVVSAKRWSRRDSRHRLTEGAAVNSQCISIYAVTLVVFGFPYVAACHSARSDQISALQMHVLGMVNGQHAQLRHCHLLLSSCKLAG